MNNLKPGDVVNWRFATQEMVYCDPDGYFNNPRPPYVVMQVSSIGEISLMDLEAHAFVLRPREWWDQSAVVRDEFLTAVYASKYEKEI